MFLCYVKGILTCFYRYIFDFLYVFYKKGGFVMKKIIKILYIIIFIVVLSGCNGQKNIEVDYDISIISTDKISLFKQQNGSITLQKELKRNDNFGFLKEDYFNLKDKMFIKTTVIGKKLYLLK